MVFSRDVIFNAAWTVKHVTLSSRLTYSVKQISYSRFAFINFFKDAIGCSTIPVLIFSLGELYSISTVLVLQNSCIHAKQNYFGLILLRYFVKVYRTREEIFCVG